ncbi:ROK family protein [Octadecabacter ascidiaceicola]|uniref:N-acetyl-D-glucosamine kinase n=1 Tax=Octadecabacter ascidiaceicola TaxID=1655543 RepID=A0A238KPL1_9RHOB|nr:ROK family protein [Octadecabacter ascidiaceicola]SMX44763.1 N-acetyl-D-glucosamine kinase [Octadecabacter ascidiaceicola]
MTAIGIDLGGTKIETQIFDEKWTVIARQRVDTPHDYDALVNAVALQINWAVGQTATGTPVGIGAAGLVNPNNGQALTANLVATGHPFPADIAHAAGCTIKYVNDCRALALSEAVFGLGKGHRTVMALILGTGIGGGISVDQRILQGPTLTGGEFGHTSAPAHLVAQYDLPIWQCGCGRTGCIETYIAGPGLVRLAKHITGQELTTHQIAAARDNSMEYVWRVWCDLTADLLHTLTLTVDPDLIILGGGLTQIDGIVDDLTAAAKAAQLPGFGTSRLVLAEGGDTSGARGAAFAAWQEQLNV